MTRSLLGSERLTADTLTIIADGPPHNALPSSALDARLLSSGPDASSGLAGKTGFMISLGEDHEGQASRERGDPVRLSEDEAVESIAVLIQELHESQTSSTWRRIARRIAR